MPRNTVVKKKKNISVVSQLDLFSWNKKKKRRKKLLKKLKRNFALLSKQSRVYKYYLAIWIIFFMWYLFFFSTFFTVKEIYIYRDDSLSDIDAAYRSLNYVRWDNIYFVDPWVIVSRLKNTQKAIKQIDINKKIPDTIEIRLQSYAPLFRIWNTLALENGSMVQNNWIVRDSLPELSLYPDPSDDENLNFTHLEKILALSD